MKRNEIIGIIVVAALLFGAFYVGSTSGTKAIGGGTGKNTTTILVGGSTQNPVILLSTYYNNTGTYPATPVPVSTTYAAYKPNSLIPFSNSTTSASGTVNLTGINYGQTIGVFNGNNIQYFVQYNTYRVINQSTSATVPLIPINSPTITYNNGTIANYVAQAQFYSVPNGYTETQLQLKITAGKGFFGNPNYALVFAYNGVQESNIQLNGYSATSVPSSAISTPAGYSTQAYSLSSIGNFAQQVVNPIIYVGTLPANTEIPSNVDVYLVSQATYNNNGAAQAGLYVNPTSRAPLVATVASLTTSSGGIQIYG